MRWLVRSLLLVALLVSGMAVWGWRNARADPVVRRETLSLPGWPAGAAPVRAVLLSDIHIASAAMDAYRLARIVAQVNALKPDIVLIAGDFVAGHEPDDAGRFAVMLGEPLRGLRAPLGTVAVLGNHDHWTGPRRVTAALRRAGITVLANDAVQRGPLTIVGFDDSATAHAHVANGVAAARRLRGARVVLTHDPQLTPYLPAELPLVLGGHSHCGQIDLPIVGALATRGIYDPRYRCGTVRQAGRVTIISAGLGTSVLPMRFNAPPDLWVLTLGPAR